VELIQAFFSANKAWALVKQAAVFVFSCLSARSACTASRARLGRVIIGIRIRCGSKATLTRHRWRVALETPCIICPIGSRCRSQRPPSDEHFPIATTLSLSRLLDCKGLLNSRLLRSFQRLCPAKVTTCLGLRPRQPWGGVIAQLGHLRLPQIKPPEPSSQQLLGGISVLPQTFISILNPFSTHRYVWSMGLVWR